MPEGYLHLTCEQRCQIYALLQSGHSQAHIARQIGVDPSTISRELVRNTGARGRNWQKKWNTLVARPTVFEWSSEIEEQIKNGTLSISGKRIKLLVIHDGSGDDIWNKVRGASTFAKSQGLFAPFRLKVSASAHQSNPSPDGLGALSQHPFPADVSLHHLTERFSALVEEINAVSDLPNATPSKLKSVWTIWNDTNMRLVPNPCDLHALTNQLLQQIRSHEDLATRRTQIQLLIKSYLTKCPSSTETIAILNRINSSCEELSSENKGAVPDDLIKLVERLRHRHPLQDRKRLSTKADGAELFEQNPTEYSQAATSLIPATILIVDDNKEDLARIVQMFKLWSADLGRRDFELSILAFPPLAATVRQHEAHFDTTVRFAKCFEMLMADEIEGIGDELGIDIEGIYGSDYREALRSLQAIVLDYEIICGDTVNGRHIDGFQLAQKAQMFRPGVDRLLLTGVEGALDLAATGNLFGALCWKPDLDYGQGDHLLFSILDSLQRKYETPFWTGLKKFAERPVITCHAMALSHGRSARKGAAISDFVDFYKLNYSRAEASATIPPLDSLLHPTGSIREAHASAQRAFGSKRSLFVTNGTSTANKIVLQALLRAGDHVLVDRNCHISHHYAIALARACPYYMEPYQLPPLKMAGGIPLEAIKAKLEQMWADQRLPTDQRVLPRALLITNCTFDGIICDPRAIIRQVREVLSRLPGCTEDRLDEIAFVFDEAWFAFARFHPHFVRRTAMAAALELEMEDEEFYRSRLRVYVTQSTHKTLSAFRQASMIYIRDPHLYHGRTTEKSLSLDVRLEQAFLTHTSTSPHAGIIASLDVARRQVELEGAMLVGDALDISRNFRTSLARRSKEPAMAAFLKYFDVLSEKDLIPEKIKDQFDLDPTKVTLLIKGDIAASKLKRAGFKNLDRTIGGVSA